jgi:hypothetical protein
MLISQRTANVAGLMDDTVDDDIVADYAIKDTMGAIGQAADVPRLELRTRRSGARAARQHPKQTFEAVHIR